VRPWLSTARHDGPDRAPEGFAMPDLSSVRALELTWAWAGPFVGRFLGAFGADVVRIEAGRWPDGWRGRPKWKDAGVAIPDGVDPEDINYDAAALFNGINRNKRSASIDLTVAEGRETFLRLLDAADVLVLNMTHHVLSQRGVEDEVMAAVDKGLVVVNLPMLGATGPYRSMPGYGTLAEAMGGFASRFGSRREGARGSMTYYPDDVGGLHATVAALSGLAGGGAFIDLSQQEAMWLQLGETIAFRSLTGREPARMGNAEPGLSPSGLYPAAGDRWVAIVTKTDDDWAGLVKSASPRLDRFAPLSAAERVAARDELDAAVAAWTAGRSIDDVVADLQAARVPCQPVESFKRLFWDGGLGRRDLIEEVDHPVTGRRWYAMCPVRVDGRRVTSVAPAPTFGQHTDEVLRQWAGLDEPGVGTLRAKEAVGTMPRSRNRSR
jgi:crotonobetainyl-CoA:carnitine CoA-transferase CaiB-like acyl-CoA transferase